MIRRFEHNDLEQVMDIWLNENIKAHSFIAKEYWIKNYEFVKSILPEAKIYVYTESNQILGFIGVNDNYIEGIFVRAEFHNKGIGTALLNQIKQKYTQLILKVYKKNKNALAFYEHNKFEAIEENIDFETNETELTMVWRKYE